MQIQPVLVKDETKNINFTNQLYEFYTSMWNDTWKELNTPGYSLHDDFLRFKYKLGLIVEDNIAAFHGYSTFNLNLLSDRNHSYFKKLNAPVVEKLQEKNLTYLATTEYMCVAPNYRKVANQYLGEILGAFSAQYFRKSQFDAMITVARNDRSVNKMCKMYGAYPIYENLPLNNVEVDIMVFEPKNIKNHPDAKIQTIVDELFKALNFETINTGAAA